MSQAQIEQSLQQALSCHRAGDLEHAATLYEAVLALDAGQFDALHYSGVLALQQGDTIKAVERLKQAVDVRPKSVDARCNLGLAQLTQRDAESAIEQFAQVLKAEPSLPPALNGLARAYLDAGHPRDASRHAVHAVKLLPDNPTSWRILGEVESALHAWERSIDAYHRAVALAPDDAELLYNLGVALEENGRWIDARDSYRKTLEVNPQLDPALSNLAFIKRALCDWNGMKALLGRLTARVSAGASGISPFLMLALSDDRRLQRQCAETFAKQYPCSDPPFIHTRERKTRISVGYLSSGYRRYPTATLIPGVIEKHDRNRFRVVGLSTGADDGSDERARLKQGFDEWLELRGVPAREAANRIHSTGVDILIDLKGHSDDAPTAVTALRPAPVQTCWVGYPGTTGADFMDYLIADRTVVPPEHDHDYSEALVRLNTCYQPNDDKRLLPTLHLTRAACGLPENALVLCCFNNLYKLDPIIFDQWLSILHAVPQAVLWLLASKSDQGIAERLRAKAKDHAVAPERLVFAGKRPRAEYLDQLRLADLMLDTFPYNAHTTGSDALWMGCPLITSPGNTFAGRVSASLLKGCNLDELIIASPSELTHATIALLRNAEKLHSYRSYLESNRSQLPLFDTALITSQVEQAYELMMERWTHNLAPETFDV